MKTRTILTIATIISLLLIAGLVGLGLAVRTASPGSGYSVGTVINEATEGVVFRRPVLYLLHAGEMHGERFAISSDEVAAQARHFADTGERVKVHYGGYLLCWAWNYASCTVIDSIVAEPAAGAK